MWTIFVISLVGTSSFIGRPAALICFIAVSFPGVSKQVAFLRIPHILFFMESTCLSCPSGVILATAFIHLLSDAFDRCKSRS
ncbi:hypothetical protein BDQ17DRAFT_1240624 [Cyathus striatus]|nr:hypothetical protein BDQ17DRAFT_1240624 [Cyathus striatus]